MLLLYPVITAAAICHHIIINITIIVIGIIVVDIINTTQTTTDSVIHAVTSMVMVMPSRGPQILWSSAAAQTTIHPTRDFYHGIYMELRMARRRSDLLVVPSKLRLSREKSCDWRLGRMAGAV